MAITRIAYSNNSEMLKIDQNGTTGDEVLSNIQSVILTRGWTLHDDIAPNHKVFKKTNLDGSSGYVEIQETTATVDLTVTLWEQWDNVTHVGTFNAYQSFVIRFQANRIVIVSANARWLGIYNEVSTNYTVLVTEVKKTNASDTDILVGICSAFSLSGSQGSNGEHSFSVPRATTASGAILSGINVSQDSGAKSLYCSNAPETSGSTNAGRAYNSYGNPSPSWACENIPVSANSMWFGGVNTTQSLHFGIRGRICGLNHLSYSSRHGQLIDLKSDSDYLLDNAGTLRKYFIAGSSLSFTFPL